MNIWLKWALLFIIGFLLGMSVAGWGIHHCFEKSRMNMGNADYILNRLSSKLDLTDDQKGKVAALLKEQLPKAEVLHKETQDKFKSLRDSFNTSLRPLLTPEQQRKLDALTARLNAKESERGFFFGCGGITGCGPLTGR